MPEKTVVVFRFWLNDVIALFPYEIADFCGNCLSYMTTGQHSAANYEAILRESRPATPTEYASLEAELTQIGYQLQVVKKRQQQRYQQALHLVKELSCNGYKMETECEITCGSATYTMQKVS